MSEYRKLGQKELLSINILLDTGEPDDWFPVFTKLFGNGVCAQFFDEKDNCDEYCPLRIRLSDEDDYKTLTIEQLLTLQIRMKNEYDGRWYWCSVFVRGRNGIYLNFFDGEDGKDCKRMLRIKL